MRKTPFLLAAGALIMPGAVVAQTSIQPSPVQRAPGPDDPIVSDSQFEEALPPLDPALQQPLEPLESIQPPADANAPPFPPVPGPVEEAPLGDPALTEPLPPLSAFEAEAIQEVQAGDASEPAPVRYDLIVNGLDEIGLTGRFRSLSALEDARGEAVNGAMIQRRAEEDIALAVRLLRSEGYYDGVATSAIEQLPGADGRPGRLRVAITAAPGQRYRFGAIAIVGPETTPPGLARDALRLASGAPIVAADVESAEANILLRPAAARLSLRRAWPARHRTRSPDHARRLHPAAGDRPARQLPPDHHRGQASAFDVAHVGVLSRFRPDQLYDRRLVDDLQGGDGLDPPVPHCLGRAGPHRRGGTGRHRICRYPGPPGGRAGAHPRSSPAATAPAKGFRLEGAWEHRNLLPPEAVAARRRRSPAPPSNRPASPLPPLQLAPARPGA